MKVDLNVLCWCKGEEVFGEMSVVGVFCEFIVEVGDNGNVWRG